MGEPMDKDRWHDLFLAVVTSLEEINGTLKAILENKKCSCNHLEQIAYNVEVIANEKK